MKTKTSKPSTSGKVIIKVKAGISKSGKTRIRGIKNGTSYKKHEEVVKSVLAKDSSLDDLKTRYLRVGSPESLILPEKISSTTYDSVRDKDISFSIGNKLPHVIRQAYNNDLVVSNGVVYGFEKKRNKVKNSSEVDFSRSDVTFKLTGNKVVLTNYINTPKGKIYKFTFRSKSSAAKWYEEILGVGVYSLVTSYKLKK